MIRGLFSEHNYSHYSALLPLTDRIARDRQTRQTFTFITLNTAQIGGKEETKLPPTLNTFCTFPTTRALLVLTMLKKRLQQKQQQKHGLIIGHMVQQHEA